jgi:hypothetical protein
MTVSLQMPAARGDARPTNTGGGRSATRPTTTKRDAEKLISDFAGQPLKLKSIRRTPLLNRDATRKFLLEFAKEARPFNKFSRVSEKTLELVNAGVRQFCQNLVRRKPSKGVTL